MKPARLGIVLALVLFASCGRGPEIPVRDFFKNPERWYYSISPDGKTISYLKPWGPTRRLNIFIRPVNGNEADEKPVTSETARDISSYFWKGNEHIIYWLDRGSDGANHFCNVDLQNGVQCCVADLTVDPNLGVVEVVDPLSNSKDEILVRSNASGHKQSSVYRLSVTNNAVNSAPAAEKLSGMQRCIVDQHGVVRGAIVGAGVDVLLKMRPNESTPVFTQLRSDHFTHAIGLQLQMLGPNDVAFFLSSPDKDMALRSAPGTAEETLYAVANIDRHKTKVLLAIDPKTGQEKGKTLCEDPEFDVRRIEYFGQRGITSVVFATTKWKRQFLDQAAAKIFQDIADELKVPEEEISITGYDEHQDKFIAVVSSDQNPGDCYLFDSNNKPKLTKLAELAPQLNGHLAPMEPIKYTSRDKITQINGYLTLPLGCDRKKRLPLVVIPHGGPWMRTVWGFNRENTEAQFFANRGYAVLQMNFRGSIGYGNDFWEAGFKKWGQEMQDDVTDGVLWAIKEREIADPDHIAIVGESYGGYSALAGITFTQEKDFRYAAAVDRAGVSDVLKFMEMQGTPVRCEAIGDPNYPKDREMLAAVSPALHADRIKTPLFVAHGLNDQTVDPVQSEEIVAALCRLKAQVEYLRFNEGHLFLNEENRIAYYEAVDNFLKKHLR
jgi:dipeptidyl aminopeptidase/acylaminoacyl peptidase